MWLKSGLSNAQIALNLGIGLTTLEDHLRKHPKLRDFFIKHRIDSCPVVENELHNTATGYYYYEDTYERKLDLDTGKYDLTLMKRVKKRVQGSFNAQKYWLEKRNPKRWPKDTPMGLDVETINSGILSLAAMLNNPAPVRKMGDEVKDD